MRKPIPGYNHQFLEGGRYQRLLNAEYAHYTFKFNNNNKTEHHHVIKPTA